MSPNLAWTLGEIGRLGFTHALDGAPLAAALAVEQPLMSTLIATGELPNSLPAIDQRVAAYVLNVLVRIELRCGGDSTALRAALDRPSPELGGSSIADALIACSTIADLETVREAAGKLPIPRVKMWRVADTYS